MFSEGGFPKPPDTIWYLEHANKLLEDQKIQLDINGVFYIGYYGLLAILLLIFKKVEIIILLQVIVNALNVVIVYNICMLLFNRRTAIISALLYAFAWPTVFWSVFILTDSLFISFVLLSVYYILKWNLTRKIKYFAYFALCSLYMIFLRPAGSVTLTFILLYIIINLDFKKVRNFVIEKKYFVLASAAILITIFALVLKSGVLSPIFSSMYWNMTTVLHTIYKDGQIYDVKTAYDYKYNAILDNNYFNNHIISFFINNWQNIIVLYAKRALAFWGVWVMNFNIRDPLLTMMYIVRLLPLMLIIIGVLGMIRSGAFRKSSVILFVVLSVQFFCIFFFIDASYRYKVPSIAFLGIITAYGINVLIDKCEDLFEKRIGLIIRNRGKI